MFQWIWKKLRYFPIMIPKDIPEKLSTPKITGLSLLQRLKKVLTRKAKLIVIPKLLEKSRYYFQENHRLWMASMWFHAPVFILLVYKWEIHHLSFSNELEYGVCFNVEDLDELRYVYDCRAIDLYFLVLRFPRFFDLLISIGLKRLMTSPLRNGPSSGSRTVIPYSPINR